MKRKTRNRILGIDLYILISLSVIGSLAGTLAWYDYVTRAGIHFHGTAVKGASLQIGIFADDGISGTRFDRPGFQRMISAVEEGQIAVVCVKDMSRFGRDYLQVGIYMEMLRKNGVRLIALNDNVDTDKGDDEFASLPEYHERMVCQGYQQEGPRRFSGQEPGR
jgi:hypothetical protein